MRSTPGRARAAARPPDRQTARPPDRQTGLRACLGMAVGGGGTPVADVLVLSHPEQMDRLRNACPEAAPTAVLAGDPCFDRMLAARPYRERFRRALGVKPGQRLVLLNSTWNPESLFGDGGGEDVLPFLLPGWSPNSLRTSTGSQPYCIPIFGMAMDPAKSDHGWTGHNAAALRWWIRWTGGGRHCSRRTPFSGTTVGLVLCRRPRHPHSARSRTARRAGRRSPVADFVRKAARLNPYAPLRPSWKRCWPRTDP